jgi:anti-sigma B factor antagonist
VTGYTDTFSAIVDRTDDAAVIRLVGELDLASAPDLQACLGDVVASTPPDVVVIIDLDELSFCDSTGISALVRAANGARRGGRRLVLRRPRPGVRRVLEITGVISVFEIED